jgi:hypothetical protein
MNIYGEAHSAKLIPTTRQGNQQIEHDLFCSLVQYIINAPALLRWIRVRCHKMAMVKSCHIFLTDGIES